MNLCWMSFSYSASNRDEVERQAHHLAESLARNGQIIDDYLIGWAPPRLLFTCHLPVAESLLEGHRSRYVKAALKRLEEACRAEPEIEIFPGFEQPDHLAALDSPAELLVDPLENSPIRDENGLGVPLYLLPGDDDVREKLFVWSQQFRMIAALQGKCPALELEAYREVANQWSSLNRVGRNWASFLESELNVPTYYRLHRFYGNEDDRHHKQCCPGCGQPWFLPEGGEGIDFQCVSCRLVSSLPTDTRGDYRARYGRWEVGPGSLYP